MVAVLGQSLMSLFTMGSPCSANDPIDFNGAGPCMKRDATQGEIGEQNLALNISGK